VQCVVFLRGLDSGAWACTSICGHAVLQVGHERQRLRFQLFFFRVISPSCATEGKQTSPSYRLQRRGVSG
jgi:hypothetical protein